MVEREAGAWREKGEGKAFGVLFHVSVGLATALLGEKTVLSKVVSPKSLTL